jgi:hypothetical protein
MDYPTNGKRVRASGCVDECVVISATALVAEMPLDLDGSAVRASMACDMQIESTGYDGAHSEASAHASRVATVKELLHSTALHIHRSSVLIADFQDCISMTMEVIRTSQQLIVTSDLAIARARSLDRT